MTRIAHVTTVHQPLDVRIYWKQACSLAAAGYDVTLVAPDAPPADALPAEDTPVRFVATGRAPSRLRRFTLGMVRTLRAALATRADVLHSHDPDAIPLAILLRLLGKRVVFDAHESLSLQIDSKPYIPALLRWPARVFATALEHLAGAGCHRIVAATPKIAAGFPAGKTTLARNFPRLEETAELETARETGDRSQPLRVVFVGGMSRARGLQPLVEAIGRVTVPVELHLAGVWQERDLREELSTRPGWSRVVEHGWCSRGEVASLLGRCDLGVVTFLHAPNHVEALPNKLFEYAAAGLPCLASDFPLWREIVEAAGCGELVDPADPASIAATIDRLASDRVRLAALGAAGRRAALEQFNWQREAESLLAMYGELAPLPAANQPSTLPLPSREQPVATLQHAA